MRAEALFAFLVSLAPAAGAQLVQSTQKISDLSGGMEGHLEEGDHFGRALAGLGDVDGDGIPDLAVGASQSVSLDGSVWVLFLNADGTVRDRHQIAEGVGGFDATLSNNARLGRSVAGIGDWDGDGTPDLAVGAPFHFYVFPISQGGVWLLSLTPQGVVKSEVEISAVAGGFTGDIGGFTRFGDAIAWLGDLDGDGFGDLAVGAPADADGGIDRGAVWILRLGAGGTVKAHQKISASSGGLLGPLEDRDEFGSALASLGDLDGDGTLELAVGAAGTDTDGVGSGAGAVWILSLNADGTVASESKIDSFGGLTFSDELGASLAVLPGFGLLAGAPGTNDGGVGRGAAWRLELGPDGGVLGAQKISALAGGFDGELNGTSDLGQGAAVVGDLDGDGEAELVLGGPQDDDGGSWTGAAFVLFTDPSLPAGVGGAGCDQNPAGSLAVAGAPVLGTSVSVSVGNPLGTQGAYLPFLVVSAHRFTVLGCGLSIPGLHMDPAVAAGEVIVNTPYLFDPIVGPLWAGPGLAPPFPLSIPADGALAGVPVFVQGATFDPAHPPGGVAIGLTRGRTLHLGI